MAAFEQRRGDLAGRLGRLDLPGRDDPVATPTLMPVINPSIATPSAAAIVDEFDPDILITNAYLLYQDEGRREAALADGVHGVLDVDVPVMTDSGSFQLARYGDIDASNEEIVAFQAAIGADVCTPIDIPTPPDADERRARDELETTLERIAAARDLVGGDRLLSGPIQGSTHADLRTRSARRTRALDADLYPVGAVVPLLESYRYADVVDVVVAAKRGLGPAAPVHLFGAGHPMMFALAVALGCDLFDSAAYAIYARDGRYLTVDGTRHLDDLREFPCTCPACAGADPAAVRDLDDGARTRRLARHNLHVSFEELRRVREAIRAGRLFELLEVRARSHPAMLEGFRRLLEHDRFLERHDPAAKGTVMYLSTESARRPEVARHHRALRRWPVPGSIALVDGGGALEGSADRQWHVAPPFGPIPPGLEHTYPLTVEAPDRPDEAAQRAAARGIRALLEGADDPTVTLAHRGWSDAVLATLPEGVELVDREDEPV